MDCNITHVCFSVRGILSHAPHTDGGGDDDAKRDGMALAHSQRGVGSCSESRKRSLESNFERTKQVRSVGGLL